MLGLIHSYDNYSGVGLIEPDEPGEGQLLGFRSEDVIFPIGLAPGRRVSYRADLHGPYAFAIVMEGAPRRARSRKVAAMLAIFGGLFGLHRFYLGYTTLGMATILITIGLAWAVVGPLATIGLGIIEGLIYLSLDDEKFERRYLVGRRYWL